MTTTAPSSNSTGKGFKAHAISRGEIFSVKQDLLEPEPGFNERVDFGDIDGLAKRILKNGFRKSNPLIVKYVGEQGIFHVTHGERRLRAIRLIVKWGKDPGPIWCMLESRDTSPFQQLVDQVLTNTGEQFTPLEKGRVYVRMQKIQTGITQVEIAEIMGETKQAVSEALRLATQGSPALHTAIEKNRISSTTGCSIIKEAGADHAAQDALLDRTLQQASGSGKTHATPQHLPAKERKAKAVTAAGWNIGLVEPLWNEANVCESPCTVTATGAKWGITLIEIRYAQRDGKWYASFGLAYPDGGSYSAPNSSADTPYPTADAAILNIWVSLALQLAELAEGSKDKEKILTYTEDLGTALQAIFTMGGAATASDGAFIADLSDEADPVEDLGTAARSDAPADPGAIERIKNASSTGRTGGTGAGSEKYVSPDKALESIDAMLDKLDEAGTADEARLTTVEIVLGVINNERPVSDLKNHLLGKKV